MVEYISNTQDVRELASSVVPPDFPDDEVIEEQKAAFNYICIYTHKFDWSPNDPEYSMIQKLETQLAACFILDHYGNQRFEYGVNQQMANINMLLEKVFQNLTSPTIEDEELITSTAYKSWRLNADFPYNSKLDPRLRFGGDSRGTFVA